MAIRILIARLIFFFFIRNTSCYKNNTLVKPGVTSSSTKVYVISLQKFYMFVNMGKKKRIDNKKRKKNAKNSVICKA